ncbi:MAG: hypothetical protein A2Z46_02115 [Nitrospirae bacterium RBG_19FT_COMBO_55_12]|nr:MAG: hypothetical protein A2Z46_02115 [Nitrospirae bacterium RBG_19FT_COMBO_55_12]
MFCPHCGKEIADSHEFCQYCGDGVRVEGSAPGAGEREKTPWEDRAAQGAFKGLLKTVKGALFSPVEFFKKMAVTGGFLDPILYGLIVVMVGVIFSYLWQILFQGSIQNYLPAEMKKMPWFNIFPTLGLAVLAVLMPFMIILGLFIWSGILHVFLMMVKGTKNGFEATFRVVSYSYSPNILNVIPFCGGVIAWVWSIVLAVIGLKEAHETSGGKAAFAVLFPFLLCCGLAVAVALLMMGVMAASIGAAAQH